MLRHEHSGSVCEPYSRVAILDRERICEATSGILCHDMLHFPQCFAYVLQVDVVSIATVNQHQLLMRDT